MKKDFLLKIKEKLNEEKLVLKSKLLEKSTVIDMDGDEVDEIQGKQLAEINNQLNIRNTNKIKLIDDALLRIENKSYGKCVDCDDLISEKRLEYNPYCVTCISCAEEREIGAMQKGK